MTITLDEAIAHAYAVACGDGECADEHAQLVAWLKELRDYRCGKLGGGECEWVLEHSGTLYDKWKCGACGYLYVESRTDGGATDFDPNYCPHCGFKIRKAVKR